MSRAATTKERNLLIWGRILEAAKNHHSGKASQRQIAADAGATPQAVNKWSKGINAPLEATLARLADCYSVSLEWLAGFTADAQQGSFEPIGDASERAFQLSKEMSDALLPDGTIDQYFLVIDKALKLVVEGKSDQEIRGHLFELIAGIKKT